MPYRLWVYIIASKLRGTEIMNGLGKNYTKCGSWPNRCCKLRDVEGVCAVGYAACAKTIQNPENAKDANKNDGTHESAWEDKI
jgi:hypothetical protein